MNASVCWGRSARTLASSVRDAALPSANTMPPVEPMRSPSPLLLYLRPPLLPCSSLPSPSLLLPVSVLSCTLLFQSLFFILPSFPSLSLLFLSSNLSPSLCHSSALLLPSFLPSLFLLPLLSSPLSLLFSLAVWRWRSFNEPVTQRARRWGGLGGGGVSLANYSGSFHCRRVQRAQPSSPTAGPDPGTGPVSQSVHAAPVPSAPSGGSLRYEITLLDRRLPPPLPSPPLHSPPG